MDFKRVAFGTVTALLLASLYFAWLWQPERQLRRHQTRFIRAVEKRNWEDINALIADTYVDRWDHDKDFVIDGSREVFRQFLFLTIQQEITDASVATTEGRIEVRLRISGSGSAVAQYAMAKVNTLAEPFTFTWAKSGWQPWRWRLTRLDHPKLEIGAGLEF